MVFSSLSFLYFFFPVVFILYFVIKNRTWRNGVLLAASLLFYSWGEPKRITLMILATCVAYVGGLLMEFFKARQKERERKITCAVSVVLLIANLFAFKYFYFTVAQSNINLTLPHSMYTDTHTHTHTQFFFTHLP